MEPWAKDLISHVTSTVADAAREWAKMLSEMGTDESFRKECVQLYKAKIETLSHEMANEMKNSWRSMMDKIENMLQEAEQLCKKLRIRMPNYRNEKLGLSCSLKILTQKVDELREIYEKRCAEVLDLNRKQSDFCNSLGIEPALLPNDPLPSAEMLEQYAAHIENLETEKFQQDETFFSLKDEVLEITRDLKREPKSEFERSVLSDHDSSFTVTYNNMKMLKSFHTLIKQELEENKRQINSMRDQLREIWNTLCKDMDECEASLKRYSDFSNNTLCALQSLIKQCNGLKKAKLEEKTCKLSARKKLKSSDSNSQRTPSAKKKAVTPLLPIKHTEFNNKKHVSKVPRSAAPKIKVNGTTICKPLVYSYAKKKRISQIRLESSMFLEVQNNKENLGYDCFKEQNCKLGANKKLNEVSSSASNSQSSSSGKKRAVTPLLPIKHTKCDNKRNISVPRSAPTKIQVNGSTICGPLHYSSAKKKSISQIRHTSLMHLAGQNNKEDVDYKFFKSNVGSGRSTMCKSDAISTAETSTQP